MAEIELGGYYGAFDMDHEIGGSNASDRYIGSHRMLLPSSTSSTNAPTGKVSGNHRTDDGSRLKIAA
jgi:hypothetical protein